MFYLWPNARLKSKETYIKKKLLSSDMFTISSVCDFAYVPCLLGMLFFSGGTIEVQTLNLTFTCFKCSYR